MYELRTTAGRSEIVVEALGERTISSLDLRVFLVEETRSADDAFDAVNPVGYIVEDGYVARLVDLAYDGAGGLRALGGGQATRVLPLAPRPGMRWTQETRVFATEEDGARRHWEAEIRTRDPIEVPAGRFSDVLEVRSSVRDAEGAVLARYRDVFARDVGLVYSAALDRSGDPSGSAELRLLRYRIRASSAEADVD